MFSDSIITQNFQLSKTKCGYYINHGIAPYMKSLLMDGVTNSPYYALCFDESLNKII